MRIMEKPKRVTGTFIIKAAVDFYDDEATSENLRLFIEQCLQEAEINVEYVKHYAKGAK